MAKEATKSFVLRVDAATMEAVERWAADEFRSTTTANCSGSSWKLCAEAAA